MQVIETYNTIYKTLGKEAEISTDICFNCDRQYQITIPYIDDNHAGYISLFCPICGVINRQSRLVPLDDKRRRHLGLSPLTAKQRMSLIIIRKTTPRVLDMLGYY